MIWTNSLQNSAVSLNKVSFSWASKVLLSVLLQLFLISNPWTLPEKSLERPNMLPSHLCCSKPLTGHHSMWMPDRVTGFINNCHHQNSFLSTLRLFSVSSSCGGYTQGKDLLSNSSSAVSDGWAGHKNFAINFYEVK